MRCKVVKINSLSPKSLNSWNMSIIHLQSLQLGTILVSFQSNPHKNRGPRIEINEQRYTPRFIIVTLP